MNGEKKLSKYKKILIVVLIVLGLLLALVGFITDFLWFRELGYVSVFFTKLFTQLKIGIPVFVVVGFLVYIYLKLLKKGYYKKVESLDAPNEKTINVISWVLALIFAGVATFFCVTRLWYQWLNFINSTSFEKEDPLYNNDISLYVFKLPFIQEVIGIVIALAVAFIILTLIYYSLLMSMRKPVVFEEVEEEPEERFNGGEGAGGNFAGFGNMGKAGDVFGKFTEAFGGKGNINRPVKKKKQFDDDNFKQLMGIASKQLIVVGVVFFVMLGIYLFLKQYDLLYNHTGAVYGAGYTDVKITMWMYRVLAVLSLVGAVGFIIGISKKKIKSMLIIPVIMLAVGGIGTGGAMLIQNYVVSPDELNKESEYLQRNIEYTQYAYGLDDVDVKKFSASKELDINDINKNPETITNIRINDYTPANKFYNQTQAITQYYNFNDVDVDRYYVNGKYTQTFLSAREIDEEQISNTWMNTHIKYTHGYGVTLSRVDKVTSSGQPDVLIGNIPPESEVNEIKIDNPAIYFGEATNNYVLVGTDEKEFDYPDGSSNQYTKYTGTAGIEMNFFNRCLFAIKERSLKLLVSSNITKDSKIVINRNIASRMKKIMPYLYYDKDPYMVTVGGNLYWICDAYTTTSKYPYSEPYDDQSDTNYIRNSVKVVVDAYNGDVDYYLVDDTDPIANTLQKIYPKLFKDFDEMDKDLQAHIRYPNTLFDIQAAVYERYHMDDVSVFYQNEDLWSIANEIYGKEELEMTPNYYILKLPGESQAEFVNSIPYTRKNKKNMTSLLMARNDGENYGNLVLYQFPKSKVVYGPMQVEALIDQNTEISKEFALWSSSGTSYSRGNLFIIPIEDSLLYVEPVYLEATKASIPEVKRVIVVFNDKIAYEPTLAEALSSMFGEGNKGGDVDPSIAGDDKKDKKMSQTELIKAANEAFEKAQAAQKSGDWTKYGKYLDELEKYLNELQ